MRQLTARDSLISLPRRPGPATLKITDRGTLGERSRAAAGRGKQHRRSQRAARYLSRQKHNLLPAIPPVVQCVIGVATNISNTSNTCRPAETDCEPARERVYFLA